MRLCCSIGSSSFCWEHPQPSCTSYGRLLKTSSSGCRHHRGFCCTLPGRFQQIPCLESSSVRHTGDSPTHQCRYSHGPGRGSASCRTDLPPSLRKGTLAYSIFYGITAMRVAILLVRHLPRALHVISAMCLISFRLARRLDQ